MFVMFIPISGQAKADAAIGVHPKGTLKGLESVYVLVESLPSDAKQIGLTKKQIQTDVELKLRRNKINVSPEEIAPHLYVNLNVQKFGDLPVFAYCIVVEFSQPVMLVRAPKKRCLATTWDTGGIGSAGELVAKNAIRQGVKDFVDEFINDYLAVNQE